MDWCGVQPGEVFYSGALSINNEGCFYLKMGRWPASSFLIYTDGLKPLPGRHEKVVFYPGSIV